MTVYSASSLMAVNLSEAHGGCGSPHSRPVRNGAPGKLWKLDCVMCENHLRNDDLWSTTVSEIPETYDEKSSREDWEKRGAQDRDAIMPLLLAKLAGVDPSQLPESLTRAISGTSLHIPGMMECPKGHAQPSGQDFCGKCGSPMHDAAPAGSIPPPAPAPDLASLHPQKLRKLCRERGLNDSGTRPEMIARLTEAERVAA
jgi:SAP domain